MAGAIHRLLVLPFANISPDPGDEYFADGMTEELIAALSKATRLRVIARTSAMKYKGATKTVAEIGRELNVDTVLEGSVRKARSKVRITVQLVDVESQEHLWSEAYDRDLDDIFAVQSDIAQRVAKALRVQIARREKQAIERRETTVLEAYTLYLKGRYHWNQRSEEGLKAAISLFEEALGKDPSYARAYSGLADAYALLAWFEMLAPHDAFPKARAAAEKALEIDGKLGEAHTSLGLVKFQYEWNWSAAESEFAQAIKLAPNYPTAHQFYADYLKAMARLDEAIAQMRIAIELDPLNLAINTGFGHVLYLSRRYDEAIAQYRKAIELDPAFLQARLWFGRPYLQKGMYKAAIEELQEAVRLSSGSTMSLAVLGHAYAAAGRKEEANRIVQSLLERSERQYLPSYWIALIYIGLDDRDQAFEWLEKAYRERSAWLVWSGVEPRFDVLRPDPRFAALLGRIGLSKVGETVAATLQRRDEREAQALLGGLGSLKLSRYRVVGNCYRYDASARNLMKDLKQKITTSLETSTPRNENYLLWSPPGAGKTFFVQQVRASVGPHVRYRETNLAETDESEFRSRLAQGGQGDGPSLDFIDEIDSKPREPWPYEALLPYLEPAGRTHRVFVLAGSSGPDLDSMAKAIASRPKGTDLLSRVPHENLSPIPPMTLGDRLLVVAASLHQAANAQSRKVTEIEKLALYYTLSDPELMSARQIREFMARCLRRVPRGDDRVKYDHLFDPGDPQNKEFWMRTRPSAPELSNAFVTIEE